MACSKLLTSMFVFAVASPVFCCVFLLLKCFILCLLLIKLFSFLHATSPCYRSMNESRKREFLLGARDTLPMIIGAIPFGILFGALATSAGLSITATLAMSLFVFAGSSQFVAATLIGQGVGIAVIVLTTFFVNLRHALYSASLGPYFKGLPQKWLLPLGFFLTDETYAVVVKRLHEAPDSKLHRWYCLGSALAMYGNWQLCTVIGITAGSTLENLSEWGLEFAMIVTFIGIVVPLITRFPMLVAAIVAIIVALLTYDMAHNFGLIVASVAGVFAGYLAEVFGDSNGAEVISS